jgi:apolipoprotein D and lipocalin family protein
MRRMAWAMVLMVAGAIGPAFAQTLPREPVRPVDLSRYLGKWYEQGRYEQSFQRGCEGVTAEYSALPDGRIRVVNSCRQDSVNGPLRQAEAKARVVEGSGNAKLKVSFFWPFEGDYWVLDHAPDYAWAIVGEASGDYLWILTRDRRISAARYKALALRAERFGYDIGRLRRTAQ